MIGSDRHHDRLTLQLAPILQRQEKPGILALDRRHVSLIDLRDRPLLEPEAILNERLQRHGIAAVAPGVPGELFEPVVSIWIGEVGRPPMRSEQHALRHVLAPHLQRPAEDGDPQASAEEMRRRGEPVGTGADHHHVKRAPHDQFFLARAVNLLMASRAKVVVALTAGSRPFQAREIQRRIASRVKVVVALTAGSGSFQWR